MHSKSTIKTLERSLNYVPKFSLKTVEYLRRRSSVFIVDFERVFF